MSAAHTRVLGIDPGLTRCGVGVIDVSRDRRLTLVHVGVIETSPGTALEQRLLALLQGVRAIIDDHDPRQMAIERVFSQNNVSTVMGVAQVSGCVLAEAADRGIPIQMHTPSEVKAAVTGYGRADKAQVGSMVARLLRLEAAPKPADAADALALAITAALKTPLAALAPPPATRAGARGATGAAAQTGAQAAWLAAERAATRRR